MGFLWVFWGVLMLQQITRDKIQHTNKGGNTCSRQCYFNLAVCGISLVMYLCQSCWIQDVIGQNKIMRVHNNIHETQGSQNLPQQPLTIYPILSCSLGDSELPGSCSRGSQ